MTSANSNQEPVFKTTTGPRDKTLWEVSASIKNLDSLGTDIYWVNEDLDFKDAIPTVRELDQLCKKHGKIHHEWLQCWDVRKGREPQIYDLGKILVRENPDALYIWGWQGQVGTVETCDVPLEAWKYACRVIELANESKEFV